MSALPWTPFNIKRNGVLLTQAEIKTTIDTGITMSGFPGIVNPFYEIAACNAANYKYYHDWQDLSSEQKEVLVGHYFAGTLLENHKSDAQNRASEKASKGRGKK